MTTDRELMQMALYYMDDNCGPYTDDYRKLIEALRARLAQPEQEPVAWITGGGKGELWWHQSVKFDVDGNLIGENPDDIPLYTAPPQREWQGLTDEEIREFEIWLDDEEENHGWNPPADIVKYIEAKLKAKNA